MEKKVQRIVGAVKSKFDTWRVLIVVFLAIYLIFLLLDLGSMAVRWDEANHLYGGFLLLQGHLNSYMSTDSFYPPLYDLITASYFAVAGPSVITGRLVAVTFAALTVLAVFEFARRVYGPRTAFVSAVLLGTMPGIIWLGRVAMLDIALLFFSSASMMLFFLWLQKHNEKYLILSGVALGLGFLAKYPIVVVVFPMLASILLIGGGYMRKRLTRFPYLIFTAVIIVVPWLTIMYQNYSTGMFNQWFHVMNLQIPQNLNVPAPLFYLIAMVYPYGALHPISILVYGFGLVGLGFLAWRRRPEDKFLLVWFFTAYIFFTFIGQMQWRYIVTLFPVIAISAASLITSAFSKAEGTWSKAQTSLKRIHFGKIAAIALVAITVFAVAYSGMDAYNWVRADNNFKLPLGQASEYIASRLGGNGSLVVLCPINVFSDHILRFYVHNENHGDQSYIWQYPNQAVDAYKFDFNVTELIDLCNVNNAKYLLLFEYGETYPYFDSNLTMQSVNTLLMNSHRFTLQTSFGSYPQKIFVFSFT